MFVLGRKRSFFGIPLLIKDDFFKIKVVFYPYFYFTFKYDCPEIKRCDDLKKELSSDMTKFLKVFN